MGKINHSTQLKDKKIWQKDPAQWSNRKKKKKQVTKQPDIFNAFIGLYSSEESWQHNSCNKT